MPKRLNEPKELELSEAVRRTAEHRSRILRRYGDNLVGDGVYLLNAAVYQRIASALPGDRKMKFDDTALDLVSKTEDIPTEEIIGQLPNITFPFDNLWLHGPGPFKNGLRIGAQINADQERHAFDIVYVLERFDDPRHLYNRNHGRDLQYLYNGKVLDTRAAVTRVSPDGIALDEDKLLSMMASIEQSYRERGTRLDATRIINEAYSIADFYARLFVTLNSKNVHSNFLSPESDAERQLREQNKRRQRMGLPPRLDSIPIIIDVTKTDPRLLDDTPVKSVWELLGVTNVKRSNYIRRPDGSLWLRQRDGQPWFRKPHKRRIRAAVDRTDAPYLITATNTDAQLEPHPDRPPEMRTVQTTPPKADRS